MKINLKILGAASILADNKCEGLQEKILVSNMMLRRRLTRSARIAIYLASKVGYSNEKIVFGTAYGEAESTANIVEAIYHKEAISPTAFQNSVHNTPVSYLSILSGNQNELTTVSDLNDTSLSVLKIAAIKALKGDKMLLLNIDAFSFPRVEELNRCSVAKLEAGVALLVEKTNELPNIVIENKVYKDVSPSLWQMLEVYEKSTKQKKTIVEVEI